LGGYLYLDLHDSHKAFERILGIYEVDKLDLFERLLGPGMHAVDVGAAKGDFVVAAAKQVTPGGRVLALEPHPENCRWLDRSLRRSGCHNAELVQAAAGAENRIGVLHLSERSEWHSLLSGQPGRNKGSIDVRVRTLDSLLDERGWPADVIKIDVEGAEMQVLQGAELTLARNPDVVLLLDLHPDLGVDANVVISWLAARGLACFQMEYPHRPVFTGGRHVRELVATASQSVLSRIRGNA
jgi:FkbM family methyltransferase